MFDRDIVGTVLIGEKRTIPLQQQVSTNKMLGRTPYSQIGHDCIADDAL